MSRKLDAPTASESSAAHSRLLKRRESSLVFPELEIRSKAWMEVHLVVVMKLGYIDQQSTLRKTHTSNHQAPLLV
jgi:hypothetical protein